MVGGTWDQRNVPVFTGHALLPVSELVQLIKHTNWIWPYWGTAEIPNKAGNCHYEADCGHCRREINICLQGGIFTCAFFYFVLFSRDNCSWGWSLLTLSFGLTLQGLLYFLHDWALLQSWRVIYHSDWFSSHFFFSSLRLIRGGGRRKVDISMKRQGYQPKYSTIGRPRV